MAREYLELEETKFNGDLSCFRILDGGDGVIVCYAGGRVNEV